MKNNLWILTEERPKINVLEEILRKFTTDYGCGFFANTLRLLPILDEDSRFTFTYEVIGFSCAKVDKVFIKTISGSSSFIDFLIFYQGPQPMINDTPIYAIEETKTDDSESRNTGVYQRCSKFVYLKAFYPNVKMIMLYNLQIEQKKNPTETNIFGTKLLLTLGVEILGKKIEEHLFIPFNTVDELIVCKNSMRRPPVGNVPILLTKTSDKIQVSGRLLKNGGLSHDPNVGALTIIAAVLRKLGWDKKIEIIRHGLSQKHIGQRNKFISIANAIDISLAKLDLPKIIPQEEYWHYETDGEKLGTIFIHTVVESFTQGYSLFENHAGCEKGYFITQTGAHLPLAKYKDRAKYKAGDRSEIIHIPDLILIDFERSEVVNVEGKQYRFREKGIAELANYDYIEKEYIKKYYPRFEITRTVVLYGGQENEIVEIEVGFLLNKKGTLVLGVKAPKIFVEAIKNLLDYWRA